MAHQPPPRSTPRRLAFREQPFSEALAIDRRLFGASLAEGSPPQPGAFFFDIPAPLRFLAEDGQPMPGCLLDGGIGVLAISGPLEHRLSWWCSYEGIAAEVAAALAHPGVRTLVLKLDSPGGVAAGMGQAHRAIRKLRADSGKMIVAYVCEQACSAAYNIASACDEIWLPREGEVGSIGVILCTVDESARLKKEGVAIKYVVSGERKADLHPGSPVTRTVLNVAQQKVDELAGHFFAAVAKSRGVSAAAIEALQAGVYSGKSAVNVGLADGVADWPDFLSTLRA